MSLLFFLTVLALGLGVSFLSGLLGIGGGIVLAPALLYLPAALGVGAFDMRAVAGLTITQGLFACLSGAWRHHQYHFVHRSLVRTMGGTIFIAALLGSLGSKLVAEVWLRALFAALAAIAAGLMFLPTEEAEEKGTEAEISFSRPLAALIAAVIGGLGGLVGQGGSFILIPLMIQVLRLPTRLALGSNLAIVFCSSLAGFVGKAATGQIPPLAALALVLGALPGAQLGGIVSRRMEAHWLRWLLAVATLGAALRMGLALRI